MEEQKKVPTIKESIQDLQQTSEKKKFMQSVDIMISLKNLDLRKPENKFSKEIVLPNGRGKDVKVVVISDVIKDSLTKAQIEALDKKETKKIIRENDFFVCDVPLMPYVGKSLGKFLGPLGKMPSPIPPGLKDIKPFVEAKKKTVRLRLRDSPTIHTTIGTENMTVDELEQNAKAVINEIEKTLPKGRNQIKDVYIKLTMSKAIKVNAYA